MVDKESTPGSITEAADSSQERVAEISNVSRTISEMQRQVNQKVDETKQSMGDIQGIEETQNSMNSVLSNLNRTVGSIGQGFAKVAASTAKASGDLVRGYGKAISQDISYNKQNVIAMAMARSTPLFGYFAAKFIETDVFQKAKERMKTSLGNALGSVTTKFKEGFSSLFEKLKFKKGDKEVSSVSKEKVGDVPKMQHGGYVEKGGLAKLHAAEVVMPIEKVLEKIDESIKVTRELATLTKKAQLNTLAKLGTYVADSREMQKVGIFKGFVRALRTTQTQYEQPAQQRMLRAVLSIQDSMGATIGTWPQVWQKMLIQHPTFRQLIFFSKTLTNVLASPFKLTYAIWKLRGGYQSQLSQSKNPMVATAENVGLVYTGGMWRLDNIALFTRATAEATRDLSTFFTGRTYPTLEGVSKGVWSIGKKMLRAIAGPIELAFSKWGGQLGEVVTKQREANFLMSKRDKELSAVYRKEIGSKEKEGESIFGIPLVEGAMPVIEVNIEKRFKEIEGYMKDSQKKETKLLGYNKHMDKVIEAEYVVTKRMDEREKRRTIFGFLGGIGGAAKSLLGMVTGLLGPILGMFTGGGGVGGAGLKGILMNPLFWKATGITAAIVGTSTIWDWLDKKDPKIAKGTFLQTSVSDAFRRAMPAAGFALDMAGATKSAIWEAFKSKLKGEDVNLAKLIGGIVKDAIWKFFHISEDLEKVKKIGTKVKGWGTSVWEKAKGVVGIKPKTSVEKIQGEIKKGREKYLKDHSIFNYNTDLDKLRELSYLYSKKAQPFKGSDPKKAFNYGFKQEKDFATYVQSKSGQEEYKKWMKEKNKKSVSEKAAEYWKAGTEKMSGVTEKVVEATKTGLELGKEKGEELLAGAKVVGEKIGVGTKESLTGWERLAADMGANFAQSTNILNTSINNSQRVTNTGSAGRGGYYSDYTRLVMRGDLDED